MSSDCVPGSATLPEAKGARRNTGRVWERELGTEMTVGWGRRDGAGRAAV